MVIGKHFCLVLFLCVTIKAFPTDGNATSQSQTQSVTSKGQENDTTSKNSQAHGAPSLTTTSSLLFKDTKPILTYLLGQPKKQGSLSSPAELFSPDRYEFFTFDDDGQIIKKLMSVKEIQKIIANNEKGLTGEHETPIEYYQILTVTPDVESIPAISRINPNEPLFSIHDVIASVQNVLKSEINIKQSQSNLNKTNFVATPTSDHFEILTEKPESPYTVGVQKSTQTSNSPQPQTTEPSPTSSSFETNKEFLNAVTTFSGVRLPASEINHSGENVESEATTIGQEILEEKVEPGPQHFETNKEELAQVETFKPEVLTKEDSKGPEKLVLLESQKADESVQLEGQKQQVVPGEPEPPQILVEAESQKPEKIVQVAQKIEEPIHSETPKPLPLAASITSQNFVTFTEPVEQTTLSFIPLSTLVSNGKLVSSSHIAASTTESSSKTPTELYETKPLSLIDAHPAIISNETFLEMKPIEVEEEWRIKEPNVEVEKVTLAENPSESFVKLATLLKGSVPERNSSNTESSASPSGISFTPDLANSVSSVLWQIASENAFQKNTSASTEPAFSSTTSASKLPEKIQELEPINHEERTPPLLPSTTKLPFQSFVKDEEKKNPLVVLESILRPQNKPRPFQISAAVEEETSTRGPEEPIHWVSSSTLNTEQKAYTPLSTIIVADTQGPTFGVKFDQRNSTTTVKTDFKTTQELLSSTTPPSTFVVSVSPDAVTQSPEHVKPITDKVIPLVNPLNTTNQTEPIIEGIQVIQEGNIGQIPRTTEYPGQIVKEIQKDETPEFVLVDNQNLTNSDSNTFTTHLPYIVTDLPLPGNSEEREEIAEGSSKIENVQPSTSTTFAPVEEFEPLKVTPSQNLDISFVPMLIKTPPDFKDVESLFNKKEQPQAEEITTVKEEQQTAKAEETTLSPENEKLESKILPEDEMDLKSILPVVEDDINQKVAAVKNDSGLQTVEEEIGTLKQNLPPISYSSKPQKYAYTKPTKTKPSTQVKPNLKDQTKLTEHKRPYENHLQSSPSVLELDAAPAENLGLESTIANLDTDIKRFSELCNELAFSLWSSVTHNGLSFVRSIVISPFAVTSLLAMVFLGARGPTSGQMNDVLKLDDMVTFNPHLVFRNVTESLVISRNPGVSTAVFVRELYSDKSKGKLLDFYKERAQQFYDGHVEEINFKTVGETLRRQTNHLVKRQTWGKITDFLRGSNLVPRPPLAAFSANIFQTDCTRASTKDRDGEMYFVILPASRLRRLVPIPAVVWRGDFLAGYEPQLDATAVSISPSNSAVSTIFVLPGQQGLIAPGDTLARLEHHLLGSSYNKGHWSRLMRSLLPRPGLELQIPRMSHKSVINVTASLQKMGLQDLFSADKADLTGLNGLPNDLHLSDMLQVNLFSTCGEETIASRHHSEIYPATPILRREKSADGILSGSVDNLFAISDFEDPAILALPLELRPRQARVPLSKPGAKIPEPPRLRFDRPFLFFVRHNPTGLILHMGRFNPRLMP